MIERGLVWSPETEKAQEEYFKDLSAIAVLFDRSVVNTDASIDIKKLIGFDSFETGYGVNNIELAAAEWLVRQKGAYDVVNDEKKLINKLKYKLKDPLAKFNNERKSIKNKLKIGKIKKSTEWLFKPADLSSGLPSPFETYWDINRYAARRDEKLSVGVTDENGEGQQIDIDVQRICQAYDDLKSMASFRKQDLQKNNDKRI
jgi:hypothetical protein